MKMLLYLNTDKYWSQIREKTLGDVCVVHLEYNMLTIYLLIQLVFIWCARKFVFVRLSKKTVDYNVQESQLWSSMLWSWHLNMNAFLEVILIRLSKENFRSRITNKNIKDVALIGFQHNFYWKVEYIRPWLIESGEQS